MDRKIFLAILVLLGLFALTPLPQANADDFSIVGWTLGFFLAIWLLGFVIAVPVASFLYFRFAGGEKWLVSVPLSLIAGAIFYGLFDYVLHLPFPEGTLLAWLNLFG